MRREGEERDVAKALYGFLAAECGLIGLGGVLRARTNFAVVKAAEAIAGGYGYFRRGRGLTTDGNPRPITPLILSIAAADQRIGDVAILGLRGIAPDEIGAGFILSNLSTSGFTFI